MAEGFKQEMQFRKDRSEEASRRAATAEAEHAQVYATIAVAEAVLGLIAATEEHTYVLYAATGGE